MVIGSKPFLKWVGGKRNLLPILLERIPKQYGTYHESFLGGGALFFALQPQRAILSDINSWLILAYYGVKCWPELVLNRLQLHQANHSKEYFYELRDHLYTMFDYWHDISPANFAADFIYINKTCFNGLFRVNKSGKFNVPMGKYKNPNIVNTDVLLNASKALENTELKTISFTEIKITPNDFYYFDPPYYKTFNQYHNSGFNEKSHVLLAEVCALINMDKGYFMTSNSDTPFIRELYKHFRIEEVSASRNVSCKGNTRGKTTELLIRNY